MENKEAITVEVPIGEVTQEPKLSRRDALEIGVAAHTDEPVKETKTPARSESGKFTSSEGGKGAAREETKKAVDAGGKPAVTEGLSPLSAPAEYTKEEKEDFLASDRKSQERDLRLFAKNQALRAEGQRLINEAKREGESVKETRDLASQVSTYLKSRNGKELPHSEILKAVEVVNMLQGATSGSAVIELLEARGFAVPKEVKDALVEKKEISPENRALQERLDRVETERAQEKATAHSTMLNDHWLNFGAQKNAAGFPRFPDIIGNDEKAQEIAREIGSLVHGKDLLSQNFIAKCQKRIPGLTYPKLYEEAYRISGGRIDESVAAQPEDAKEHLKRSNRAAASQPSRGLNGSAVISQVTKVPRREALKRGLDEAGDN